MTDKSERLWSMTELCGEFDVTPRALRFYEDKGLLSPARQGVRRRYSARDRGRLQLILRGKAIGFSLLEIHEMLDLYDIGDNQRAQMQLALQKFSERLETLRKQREQVDLAIADLEAAIAGVSERLSRNAPAAPPQEPGRRRRE